MTKTRKREILRAIDSFCKQHKLVTDKDKPRYNAYTYSGSAFDGRYVNLQIGILDVNKPSKYAPSSKVTMVKNNLELLRNQISECRYLIQLVNDNKKLTIKKMGREYFLSKIEELEKALVDYKNQKREYKSYRDILKEETKLSKRFIKEVARKFDFVKREISDQNEEPNPSQQWYRTFGLNKIIVVTLQVV